MDNIVLKWQKDYMKGIQNNKEINTCHLTKITLHSDEEGQI